MKLKKILKKIFGNKKQPMIGGKTITEIIKENLNKHKY